MRLPLAFIGKPFRTLCEQRKQAWAGMPVKYAYTFPKADPWKVRIRRQPTRRRCA